MAYRLKREPLLVPPALFRRLGVCLGLALGRSERSPMLPPAAVAASMHHRKTTVITLGCFFSHYIHGRSPRVETPIWCGGNWRPATVGPPACMAGYAIKTAEATSATSRPPRSPASELRERAPE